MFKSLRYLLGVQEIKTVYSPINGSIRVVAVFNRPRVMVGGLVQSGGMAKRIWHKGITKLKEESQKVNRALIIGLGCGDCALEINKHYPKAEMVGLEIDKQMVDVAERYFNLASLKKLKVKIIDGLDYVNSKVKQKRPIKFDLIIVDVFLGKRTPFGFTNIKFYKKLKKILNQNGVAIINHLFFKQHKQKAEKCIKRLEKVFPKIVLQRTTSNLLIFAKTK